MLFKSLKDNIHIIDFPVGTKFRVVNGDWYGEIVLCDGNKCVKNKQGVYKINSDVDYKLQLIIQEDSYDLCKDILEDVEYTPISTEGLFDWEDDDVPF